MVGSINNNLSIEKMSISVFPGEYNALILLRILMGFVGGGVFPAVAVLLAVWVPVKERGKLGTLVLSGSQVRFDDAISFDLMYLSFVPSLPIFRLEILYRFIYPD